MQNKCVVYGCKSTYDACKEKSVSTFHLYLASPDKASLVENWIHFVNRRDWKPTTNSVICERHFDPKFIIPGKQRNRLGWKLNPIPTIQTDKR